MNAPHAAAIVALQSIPVAAIIASKTNPRKHFDKEALDELTASVKLHGIMQPILVRPNDTGYELVAGERRLRAARAAELSEIPAMVRDLTDAQALELQVIENLQRSDLHPLEEAEGYEQLQKLHGYSVDDLVAKVGKSRAYVYARMKLTALCKEAREAFYDGRLSPSTALLIARIPVVSTQVQAVKSITQTDNLGEILSFRQAQAEIHNNFMLRLKEAPFDPKDAGLVKKAGACGACPKRTGNQPELFGDVKDADVCTDPHCYGAKKSAHFLAIRKSAEAEGRHVISGKAAKDIDSGERYGGTHLSGGYVRADDEIYIDGRSQKVATLLKKVEVDAELLERPVSKDLVEVVNETALRHALKKAGIVKSEPRSEYSQQQSASEKKVKAERAARKAMLQAVHDATDKPVSNEEFKFIAARFYVRLWHEGQKIIDKLWALERDRAQIEKVIEAFEPAELARFMLDCALVGDVWVYQYEQKSAAELVGACERRGIDAAKLRAEATPAPATKKTAKRKPAKKAKAAK
jgi:ParB/RepB/Spo0J family partition protein